VPREQPQQTYWPRSKATLVVRLEDLGAANTPPPPRKPPHVRAGKGVDDKSSLRIVSVNGAYVLQAPGQPGTGSPGGGPLEQTSSSDNRTFKIPNVVPVRATLLRNGIRVADTLTLTLRFLDFPFDPRALRAVGIKWYLGSLSEADYRKELDGSTRFYLPDSYVDASGAQRTNLRFEGWCDEYAEEVDDDGEALVTLECTDNTRLLIDVEAPAKLTIPPDKPIDLAIATYLANFPQFRGLRVEYRPVGSKPPMLKVALSRTAFRPTLGPPPSGGAAGGSGGAGAGAGGSKLTVWDYVTDVCGAIGLIAFVEGSTIVVQRPRTLYASKFSGRPGDPYVGRSLPSGRVLSNRTFIYGRNVSRYGFKRKFTRSVPQNVEVRSWSSKRGVLLAQRFPGTVAGDPSSQQARIPKLLPGDGADEQWKVITVAGIDDEATLRAVGQSVYEQLGRAEFVGRFSTKNLASFGGSAADPDVLDCQAGDAIELEVARAIDADTSRGTAAERIQSRAASYLQSLGFDSDLATAYGQAISRVGLTSTFRVRTLAIDWDSSMDGGEQGGVNLDFEVVNFLEVRSSKDLPAGEEIEPPAAGDARPAQVVVDDDAAPPPPKPGFI
jgi:hypothetical protein